VMYQQLRRDWGASILRQSLVVACRGRHVEGIETEPLISDSPKILTEFYVPSDIS
jgi:hypothetical protein